MQTERRRQSVLKQWTAERILDLARSYQPACVLAAAADLDLFAAFGHNRLRADELAGRLDCDVRGLAILLDALVTLKLLRKHNARYSVVDGVASLLTQGGSDSVLAIAQHQANCLRRWDQLATVVKMGKPTERIPSIRGEREDAAAFIGAMHELNSRFAAKLIREIQPMPFKRLLDIGGASGTWTIAFLRSNHSATAILFDLPHVIPLAGKRLVEAGMRKRVALVAGDFNTDELPTGADLAWVSAIVHQNSREQNRKLFANIFRALAPNGRILIRDILMEPSRTAPIAGALFAVNMLVGTAGGGTFTFDELCEDLTGVGFVGVRVLRRDDGMNSVLVARKRK
jgi:precorrin-6B methylase 2